MQGSWRLSSRSATPYLLLSLLLAATHLPSADLANAGTVSWVNPAGGNWAAPENWDTGLVPGAGDTVEIALDGTYVVTLSSGAIVASLTLGPSTGLVTLSVEGSGVSVAAPSTIQTGARVRLVSATLTGVGSWSLAGTLEGEGNSHIYTSFSMLPGGVLRVLGTAAGFGDLTIASGFTNNGTIELTSTSSINTAGLTITSGTLVNAPGREIRSDPGAGGATRILGAAIDNQGTITVAHSLYVTRNAAAQVNGGTIDVSGGDFTVSQSATFTTSGKIAIAAGYSFIINSGTLLKSGGFLGGAGTLQLFTTDATLDDAGSTLGGIELNNSVTNFSTALNSVLSVYHSTINAPHLTNPAGRSLTITAGMINAPVDNQGTIAVHGYTIFFETVGNAAGAKIRVEGDASGSATTDVSGDVTNSGTIEITTSSASQNGALDVVNGGLTNLASGHIEFLPGAGGALTRTLGARIDNQGTITVLHPSLISKSSADHLNSGTIDVSGGNLTVSLTGTTPSFATSGAIHIGASRTATISGGTFTRSGGLVDGAGTLVLASVTGAMGDAAGYLSPVTLTSSTATFTDVVSTAAMNLSATNSTINAPGFVNPAGHTITWSGVTLNTPIENRGTFVSRGTGKWNGAVTTMPGSLLRVESSGNSATLDVASGFTNNGSIELTSTSGTLTSTLNVTSGALTNAPGGTITSVAASGGSRTLGAALLNQGSVTVLQPLTLSKASAAHVNDGSISVSGANFTVSQSGAGASFTNNGAITVAASRTLSVTSGTWFENGSVTGAGTLSMNGVLATFSAPVTSAGINLSFSSMTVNAPALVNPSGRTFTLAGCVVNAPVDNEGLLVARGVSTFTDSIATGTASTLRVEGTGSGSATLTVTDGFTNHGTIELTSSSRSATSTLAVTNGSLVNAPEAFIDAFIGAGGSLARVLAARLDNRGLLYLSQPLTLGKPSAQHENSGMLLVSGAAMTIAQTGTAPAFVNTGTIRLVAQTLTITGGSFTNTGIIEDFNTPGTLTLSTVTADMGDAGHTSTTLNLTASTVATFTTAVSTNVIFLHASNSTINAPGITNGAGLMLTLVNDVVNAPVTNLGTLVINGTDALNQGLTTAAGSVVTVQGSSSTGNAVLNLPAGLTNLGRIDLTSFGSGNTATLNPGSGAVTNAVGGVIRTQVGSGGPPRMLTGELVNYGTLEVGHGLVMGGAFTNGAGGLLRGTKTLDVSAVPFTNSGTIAPGTSPGALTIAGNCTMTATSVLSIEIGGTAAASFDRLVLTGSLALDGALNASLVSGFVPAPGDSFPIVTWGARTGTFAVMNGMNPAPGLYFVSGYPGFGPGGATLRTVRQSFTPIAAGGTAPDARDAHSAVYDATDHRLVVFGGFTAGGAVNDVWVLTNADGVGTSTWTALSPDGAPPPARGGHVAAYDGVSRTMIVAGGHDGVPGTPPLDDVWILTNADGVGGTPAWTELHPAGPGPGPRPEHAAAYDPATKSLVVFGGAAGDSSNDLRNDAWILTPADGSGLPAWSEILPAGEAPEARRMPFSAFDPSGNRLFVAGGRSAAGILSDAWVLTNADGSGGPPAWSRLDPENGPLPPRAGHRGAWDGTADRLVLFGGEDSDSTTSGDILLVDDTGGTPAWTILPPPSPRPTARRLHSAVSDGGRKTIVFGGLDASGLRNDVWILEITGGEGDVAAVPPGISDPPPATTPRPGIGAPRPNPSAGAVRFTISRDREAPVEITVHDVAGRRVETVFRGLLGPGVHEFTWDPDARGALPNGIYWIVYRTGTGTESRKVTFVR